MTADSLAAFLLERWAEQEAAARLIPGRRWYVCDDGHVEEPFEEWADGSDRLPNHHNTWSLVLDPAYVLADIEAKRRIVELYKEERSRVLAYRSPRWKDAMNEQDKVEWHKQEARHRVAEDFALALAQPFAEHEDFRPEWKWSNR